MATSDLITKNLNYLRGMSSPDMPDLGSKLYEVFQGILQQNQNVQMQTNSNGDGTPAAPPQVNGVQVVGSNGHLSIAVNDTNDVYSGVQYFAEHADNPNFTNPQIVPMGASRNISISVGNQDRYVRVYSSYGSSPPSSPVYNGGSIPVAVNGGGTDSGPTFLPSQGSGTGLPGQGLSGNGITPFRSLNGKPPTREIQS
jgi:hypothetical protein